MARLIGKTEDDRDIYGVDFDIEVKECKQTDDGKRVVSMIGSTPSIDRDGDTIRQSGWDLGAFKKNPVILWGHNHDIPAIGRANKFRKSKEALVFEEIEFPKEGIHKFADMIYSLMEAKFIKAGSVGFIPLEMQRRKVEEDEPDIFFIPTDFKKQELIEFTVCNVGSNRDALTTHLSAKGFKTTGKVKIGDQEFEMKQLIEAIFTEEKGIIPFKHYPLADEDTPWNGPREIREADVDQLRKMSTWFDSEDPDIKNSYKLPHHQASDLKTVWSGVNASMGALFGARTPLDVPDGDRRGIYNHLKSHYLEFDKPVPDFKAYSESDLKKMFPELYEEKDVTEVPEGAETITKDLAEKPFPGEHSCRLEPPDDFDSFVRKNCAIKSDGKCIDFIFGIKEGKSKLQAMRYPKDVWTASAARAHCKEKEGTFEAAGKCGDCEPETIKLTVSVDGVQKEIEAIKKDSQLLINPEYLLNEEGEFCPLIITLGEESPALNVKFLTDKAGAVLSRSNKNKLKDAAQAINDVLAAAEPAATDGEQGNDDKPKSPEEVNLKQVLEELAEVKAVIKTFTEQSHAKNEPADDEIDLDSLKVPSDEINLEDMELPQEKDEVDMELLSTVLKQLMKDQVSEVVSEELRKATGIIDN